MGTPREILIDETLDTITFRVKRVAPKIYESQLEELENTGLLDSFEGFSSEVNHRELSLKMVYEETCKLLNVNQDYIPKNSRKREYVATRYYYSLVSLDIFKDRDDITLEKIGNIIGRDHSSVLHYKKDFNGKVENDLKYNLKTSEKDKMMLRKIKTKLNGSLEKYQTKVKGIQI